MIRSSKSKRSYIGTIPTKASQIAEVPQNLGCQGLLAPESKTTHLR